MWSKEATNYSLYLVTDRGLTRGRDFLTCIGAAVQSGVSMVQLREKSLAGREFYQLAAAVLEMLEPANVPLIINDRLDIALAVGAAGVHLGQNDLPARAARALLGAERLLGVSCNSLAEAAAAAKDGADYLGLGAVFPTNTKQDTRPFDLNQINRIKSQVGIPVLAIGGITLANVQQVWSAGVDGICVASAILGATDITCAVSGFKAVASEFRPR